jgi:hypothetical protein
MQGISIRFTFSAKNLNYLVHQSLRRHENNISQSPRRKQLDHSPRTRESSKDAPACDWMVIGFFKMQTSIEYLNGTLIIEVTSIIYTDGSAGEAEIEGT